MAKEIHKQPEEVVGHTLSPLCRFRQQPDRAAGKAAFRFPQTGPALDLGLWHRLLRGIDRQVLVRAFARLPVEIDIAWEFRYREAHSSGNPALFVSQSGEIADTLATLRYAREQKQHVMSIVPEIGVASTKAFTCQLTVLACLDCYDPTQAPQQRRKTQHDIADMLANGDRPAAIMKPFPQFDEDKIRFPAAAATCCSPLP